MATQVRATEIPSTKFQPQPAPGSVTEPAGPKSADEKHFNTLALAGVSFGLISCVFQALGVMPILGIVFSTLGLVSFDDRTEKMRWMAGFGLGLSILITMLSFR
ncbi:MAG: hypothetical protein P4L84_16870 [Isosphaeraceae bacterium]|nr:hypothetical protein [Isosphaeraceae bacterium]